MFVESVPVVVIVPPVSPFPVAIEVTVPDPFPLNVLQSVDVSNPVFAALAFWNKEEVASDDGTADEPLELPNTELALIAASPIVAFEPPTNAPAPAESVRPLFPVNVVVPTPYTPVLPFETSRLPDTGWEVVARPVQVTVEFVPPTSVPIVPVIVNGPENEWVVVATFANILTPEKYGILPTTAAVEVERPLKPKVPVVVIVPPVIGQAVAIDVTEPVPQVTQEIVIGEEPSVTAPAVTDTTPEPESVVVAMLLRALVPLPYKSCEDVKVTCPVPPVATGNAPTANTLEDVKSMTVRTIA